MQQFTRLGLAAAIVIVLLRMSVGYHFFKEGESKIRDGNFSSAGFFRQSKGELSPFFKGLLADEDARLRLCYAPESPTGTDPELTFEYWTDFAQQVAAECRLTERSLVARRENTEAEIQRLRQDGRDASHLIESYERDEQRILELREHIVQIGTILERHMTEFELFLAFHEEDIDKYFKSLDRLDGFRRDGDSREEVVEGVASLYDQRATVYGDIMSQRAPLVAQVEAAWDSLEKELNQVDVDVYRETGGVELERPYEQRPLMQWVDRIIPWHHVVIGSMIFLGLLCRPASLLAAFFLLMICACQLPWATGALPTYYQVVEMLSLLALAAIGAGRYAGLDYFIGFATRPRDADEESDDDEPDA